MPLTTTNSTIHKYLHVQFYIELIKIKNKKIKIKQKRDTQKKPKGKIRKFN